MSKLLAMTIGLGFALSVGAAEIPAPNSTLKDIDGQVSVNQGEEFIPATEGMRLKPGDRVMVGDDSEAVLEFDDECRHEVDENKIVTIPDRSSCAGGVLVEQGLNPVQGSAIGAGGTTVGPGNVAGGLIVATWAAIGYCWLKCDDDDNEDDDDTVSP